MDREFIPYELALELKQLGFDEPCLKFYTEGILWLDSHLWDIKKDVLAPTYSQAFRWFREEHNLFGQVNIHTYFIYNISNGDFKMVKKYDKLFDTYEEAELECLIAMIKLVKSKS
jgi:hypothetical protein